MRMHYSDTFIDSLILEDCPYGDLTTASLGIGARKGRMRFYPRAEKCTVSGTEPAARILSRCGLTVESRMEDGLAAEGKPCLLSCTGRADDLHRAWKIAQNVLEYMCGIATRAQDMVSAARRGRPDIAVAATRKNFPGAKLLSLAPPRTAAASCTGPGFRKAFSSSTATLPFSAGRTDWKPSPASFPPYAGPRRKSASSARRTAWKQPCASPAPERTACSSTSSVPQTSPAR